MSAQAQPLILYIPGLLPKPVPAVHRDALLRCLLAGVRRVDESVADKGWILDNLRITAGSGSGADADNIFLPIILKEM